MKTENEEYWKNYAKTLQYELAVARQNLEAAQYSDWCNLNSRIKHKEDHRLYKKKGKKYVPVNDPYAYDGLREGFWLVKVDNGCTSIRQQIYPNKAPISAAARDLEDKLIGIIKKALEARPDRALTEEENKDWKALIAKHPDVFSLLHYPSLQQAAENIIKALIDKY